jgi:hypothetical protein
VDEKIKKLDEELAQHKAAINRARPGPAQARAAAPLQLGTYGGARLALGAWR